MKLILVLLLVSLTACKETSSRVMTYQQLVDYPSSCDRAREQLKELKELQRTKNFAQDIELLNENDRAYNSRLKATIWWYTWKCGVE